jgi:hypothetical protein
MWVSRCAARCLIGLIHVAMFSCVAGYRGKNCEENIDDCPGNLCQNGATCVDDINRYSCMCPPTYMGELCEQDVDECGLRPSVCQNGATCTNSIGGFSCICVNGWAGPDCSVNIDDCAGAACFNGATCIDRVGSFYCRCTPGKTGNTWHTACFCCEDCSDVLQLWELLPGQCPLGRADTTLQCVVRSRLAVSSYSTWATLTTDTVSTVK